MPRSIIEHPFFNDYAKALQSISLREFGTEGYKMLKEISCHLFKSELLDIKWIGWEIGLPRPIELAGEKALRQWEKHAIVFLRDFFKRVENGELYCDYSVIIEKFGEGVESRIGKTSGLLFNLEAAYWTFNIKFNKWIEQNKKVYNCSLVCNLDEILARFDSYLREAFFPTPGTYDIGKRKRKKLEDRMLRKYAPTLRKALMKEIWG